MCEYWHDCAKRKYTGNVKLCYMDTDSLIVHAYEGFVGDAETRVNN